jgi:hypothetical protein
MGLRVSTIERHDARRRIDLIVRAGARSAARIAVDPIDAGLVVDWPPAISKITAVNEAAASAVSPALDIDVGRGGRP